MFGNSAPTFEILKKTLVNFKKYKKTRSGQKFIIIVVIGILKGKTSFVHLRAVTLMVLVLLLRPVIPSFLVKYLLF